MYVYRSCCRRIYCTKPTSLVLQPLFNKCISIHKRLAFEWFSDISVWTTLDIYFNQYISQTNKYAENK